MPTFSIRSLLPAVLLASVGVFSGCDKGGDPKSGAKTEPESEAKPEPETSPSMPDETESEPVADADTAPAGDASAKVGAAAPDFTLKDLEGNDVSLASFEGKTVVLEWFNPGCPFVKYAHGEGPLATMGNEKSGEDLVWLAINSGAPGKQGHGLETNKSAADGWKMQYPVLLDETGEVGKRYGAEKTPHVFVIDPDGVLRYRGALDNAPIGETQNEDYVNYLAAALDKLATGASPDPAETPPYGCSVKYGS